MFTYCCTLLPAGRNMFGLDWVSFQNKLNIARNASSRTWRVTRTTYSRKRINTDVMSTTPYQSRRNSPIQGIPKVHLSLSFSVQMAYFNVFYWIFIYINICIYIHDFRYITYNISLLMFWYKIIIQWTLWRSPVLACQDPHWSCKPFWNFYIHHTHSLSSCFFCLTVSLAFMNEERWHRHTVYQFHIATFI